MSSKTSESSKAVDKPPALTDESIEWKLNKLAQAQGIDIRTPDEIEWAEQVEAEAQEELEKEQEKAAKEAEKEAEKEAAAAEKAAAKA